MPLLPPRLVDLRTAQLLPMTTCLQGKKRVRERALVELADVDVLVWLMRLSAVARAEHDARDAVRSEVRHITRAAQPDDRGAPACGGGRACDSQLDERVLPVHL